MAVIVNRKTPLHTDSGAWLESFDFLTSAGTHKSADLEVPVLKCKFQYLPGTFVAICGQVFPHAVQEWTGGERVCLAYFMKHSLLKYYKIKDPSFSGFQRFMEVLGPILLEDVMEVTRFSVCN